MSDATKIVLGVGAVGLVGYLLLSQSTALRPQPSTASTLSTATVAATGLVNSVKSLFGAGVSQSSQTSSVTSADSTQLAYTQGQADAAAGISTTQATALDEVSNPFAGTLFE